MLKNIAETIWLFEKFWQMTQYFLMLARQLLKTVMQILRSSNLLILL